jgi:hypothetical protein
MTSLKVKKSLAPALAAALLVACGVMIFSFFIIALLVPFENPNITPAYFWRTVWHEGFHRYCGPGPLQVLNLDCRTANLRAWLGWPPFYLRLSLSLGSSMIAAILAAIWSWKHTSPKEIVRTIRVRGRYSRRRAGSHCARPLP